MKTYFRIHLKHVPSQLEDILTSHAFACGATGVSEALSFQQPNLTYEPSLIHKNVHDLDIFFPEKPKEDFFAEILRLDGSLTWTIAEEEHQDWLSEWKKGFSAFKLVDDFWVVPSWQKPPDQNAKNIFIEPGMAFGTGTHATTQMASSLVVKVTKNLPQESLKNCRLLDVGTGTGILAMLAKHNQVNEVVGIEIDQEARRVAKENIERNNLQIKILDDQIENLKTNYNVVVANIIDGILLAIKDDLIRLTAPGGDLILTGILKENDDEFFEKFVSDSRLSVQRRLEKDEWVAYWVRTRNN